MLYVQATDPEELQELRSLLDESPFIALDDVRGSLVENGHISSLARIYEKKNDQPALIDLYVKVADGVWKDESISDPVGKVKKLLHGSKDRAMVQKYALWLLKRDRSGGLKVSHEINFFGLLPDTHL
jgi:vacuolar protein sorting-associated protein 3